MKTAVLIRGHHHYDEHLGKPNTSEIRMTNSPKQFDYRVCYNSITDNIINPIKKFDSKIDIFISTYKSKIENTLPLLDNFKDLKILDINGCSQTLTLKKGLELIPNEYDNYLILRFDLLYKNNITNFWTPQKDDENIYLTWKETKELWDKHNRIGDALFIINGKNSFAHFKNAVTNYLHSEENSYHSNASDGELYYPSRSLHYAYPFIEKETKNIKFLLDEYYDTGTSSPNILSKNPIYVQYGRPYHFDDCPIS
jgi:hypothetical protein